MSVNISECPTLRAMRDVQEKHQGGQTRRGYIGASSLGHSCDRKLWYDFHFASENKFTSKTLFAFADGHYSEWLTAKRLREIPGITLHT